MIFRAKPWPKPVRVIAALPPATTKRAIHAGRVVHLLDHAGCQVKTAAVLGPAYSGQFIHFAPKRRFEPLLAKLTENPTEAVILYAEALGFARIQQKRWYHRRVEQARRLKLTAKMMFTKTRAVLVYQPNKLWHYESLMVFVIGLAAKALRPRRVSLFRQSCDASKLVEKLLKSPQPQVDSHLAEDTAFDIATREDKSTSLFLSLAWFRRAINQLAEGDPLRHELQTLFAACDIYTTNSPLPFQTLAPNRSTQPLPDAIHSTEFGIPVSDYMVHIHAIMNPADPFQLDKKAGRLGLLNWYIGKLPKRVDHALPLPEQVFTAYQDLEITAQKTGRIAAIATKQCDLLFSPFILAHYRKQNKYTDATAADRIAFGFKILSDHSRFQVPAGFAGEGFASFFDAPIGNNPENISRAALMSAILAHAPVADTQMLSAPWRSDGIAAWFSETGSRGYPLLNRFTTTSGTPPQLAITGTGDPVTGIGQNQRMSQTALHSTETKRNVYLHHVNADAIPSQMLRHNTKEAFHIGFLLWEMERLPQSHFLADKLLDEIWVPSRFLQKAYQNQFDTPVVLMGKGFDLPEPGNFDFTQYGISPGQRCFLICFDQHSSVVRKNPLAAVQAFLAAFPTDKSVRLIIKTTPTPKDHWGDPEKQMREIRRLANNDSRVILIEQLLPFKDLLALIKFVDCVISSHRAEGFGYIPAYAQKLGTAVIATDYSGTTDFCTPDTAFVIPFRLKTIRKAETIVPVPDGKWGEIDQSALRFAMLQILDSPTEVTRRVGNARELMDSYYSTSALRQRYLSRLDVLGLISDTPVGNTSESQTIDPTHGVASSDQP